MELWYDICNVLGNIQVQTLYRTFRFNNRYLLRDYFVCCSIPITTHVRPCDSKTSFLREIDREIIPQIPTYCVKRVRLCGYYLTFN